MRFLWRKEKSDGFYYLCYHCGVENVVDLDRIVPYPIDHEDKKIKILCQACSPYLRNKIERFCDWSWEKDTDELRGY